MKNRNLLRRLAITLLASLALSAASRRAKPPSEEQGQSRKEKEVARLLELVRDPNLRENNPDRVASAIKRLRELKAVAAIDDMAGLLTFRMYQPWDKDPH